jgi:hypothetical protein
MNCKFAELEQRDNFRYRLNCLLHWKSGWWKTSLLTRIAEISAPFLNIKKMTSSSEAALRGSCTPDGKFCIPDILTSNIFIIPELTTMLNEEIIRIFLTILEEATLSVSLVKLKRIKDSEKEYWENRFPIKFDDFGFTYTHHCTIWAAIHDLGLIDEELYDAYTNRFIILYIPPDKFKREDAYKLEKHHRRIDFENELSRFLESRYKIKSEPNWDFAERIIAYFRNSTTIQVDTPRVVQNIIRIALGYYELFGDNFYECCNIIARQFNQEVYTPKELLISALQTPKTMDELVSLTGMKRTLIYYYMKQLPVIKDTTGSKIKYSLEKKKKEKA